MKINCVSCGHRFDLGEAYEDFCGPVKCYICGAILEVDMQQGQLKTIAVKSSLPVSQSKSRKTRRRG